MSKVAFYKKDASILEQYNWEKRLKLFLPEIELVPLLSAEAKKVTTALLWKAPMEKLLLFDKLKGIISLGQGVDHILNKNSINKKIHIVRIVDPYMAKSMSHWVILSVLNYIRDTYGYHNQEKIKLYKPKIVVINNKKILTKKNKQGKYYSFMPSVLKDIVEKKFNNFTKKL